MSLYCPHIDAGLRIQNNGRYSPCCVARNVAYKDHNGEYMNVKTHSFDDAFKSPTLEEIRNAFKNNVKHPGCSDCWQEEALGRKSKRLRDIEKMQKEVIVYNKPHSLELNLGNICNLACRMCTVGCSMNWKDEHNLTKDEHEKWTDEKVTSYSRWHNSSFTDDSMIWEQLHSNMKYVKWIDTYGGEPMMMKKQWDALKYSVDNGYAEKQNVHFNTNGTIYKPEYVEILKNYQRVDISFSIDGTGDHFEYIRYPAKWNEAAAVMDTWIEKTKEYPQIHFDLCFTFQILNVLNYGEIAAWAKDRNIKIYRNAVYGPPYYNASNIAEHLKEKVIDRIRSKSVKYPEIRQEWEEIIDHIQYTEADPDGWRRFLKVNNNLDISRNQSFVKMFPEEAELFGIKPI